METTQKPPAESSFALFAEADQLLDRLESPSAPLTLSVEDQRRIARLIARLVSRLDRAETMEGVRRGLEQADQGLGRDARTVLAELRQKLKIPDSY